VLSIFILFTTYFIGTSQVSHKADSLLKNDTIFYPNDPDPNVLVEYETMPEFPGGDDSLIVFAKKHLVYPRTLIKDRIEGRIIIKFSVDSNGIAGDVGFMKSLHPELEKECIEMVKKLPRFKPGTMLTKSKKGWYWRPVNVWYVLPVYFTATNKNPYNLKLGITP
jgi:protein TonB